ncbi:MAG: hypothetical protein GJV46_06680 [Geobacter sp.]|nr:hypothetical protein [Geobacter sp.]
MKRSQSGLFGWLVQTTVIVIIGLVLCGLTATPSFATIFPIASNGASQSASFDGTNYLVGIESHNTSPPTIGAQLISASGVQLGPFISTGRTGIATNVAFDGTNYLLIWEDNNGGTSNGATGWQVWGQRISKAGTTVGVPFAISSTGIWFDGVKTMAFGGGKYLVTYTKLIVPANGDASTNRYIAGRIVNPDGTLGIEFRISTGYGAASDVAFDGVNFFVIWREDQYDQEIRGRFVSPTGIPGTEISVNASTAPSDNPTSVAYDGTNYLVAWNDETGGIGTGTWDVFGQLVSPSGTMVGPAFTITNEPGPQMVTSVAFDGTNYLAVWMDMSNDANGNGVCDAGEGTCWDMYGRYISRNGSLIGSKITISTDATNQMGGVGFVNGKYLVLINSGVTMGSGGFSQVASANGMFITPSANQFSASGTYIYSGTTPNATLAWTWTNSNFICNGPNIGQETQTITLLDATTLTWTDSGGSMTWTRPSGTAGNITGTWTSTDPGSGNSYIVTFSGSPSSGSVTVTADILSCGTNGTLSIDSFSPTSGTVGSLVAISGNNFSRLMTENTVLINGLHAVVTGVEPSKLYFIVPPGATSGTISVSNPGGTATSSQTFNVLPGTPAASLSWGGVHHRFDSDGSTYDALDVGIDSYATTLAGMSLTVSGPNNFTYTFDNAEITPYINGQLAIYKRFPTPATPLAAGVYTFTLDDNQGHISHRVDTHISVAATLPQVDSTKIQFQRKSDGSYRFSWPPVNDATQTYYYRLRINLNNSSGTPVYDSTRAMTSFADVPAGILFDDTTYKIRVEACDAPNGDMATNRSLSAWKLISPKWNDYNADKMLVSFAAVYNRTDGTTPSFDATLNVNDPTKITSLTLSKPDGSTLYTFNTSTSTDLNLRTSDGTNIITDFYKNFPTGTTMPAGLYTFTYQTTLGGIQTAYATLTTPVTYPVIDSATMQAQDLGNGNVRFSWANVNHTGTLYYRVVLNSPTKALSFNTSRLNQTYVDIPSSLINELTPTRWRAEVIDSNDVTTQRNRFNTNWQTLSIQSYDPAKPVINALRVRNLIKSSGSTFTQVSVNATGSLSTLTQILVTGPGGYSHNLLADGRYTPANGSYALEVPGTLTAGLYTITATNTAGKNAVSYLYVPPANALVRPDYATFHNDWEPNGDMRISWAPIVSNVPVWYSFSAYAQTDQNGDGLPDLVYVTSANVQQSSIVIPAATIGQWPQYTMAQVSATDGSNATVTSNMSQSVMVGAEMPGFNYAALNDSDSDGFASDIDVNDGNPSVYPFSSGNDALTTTVTSTNPISGATEIPATGSTFSVTFNKVIDQRTLPTSFNADKGITGVVTYNPATRTATFTPSASAQLLPGTTYTVTISTGLLDQAGHPLAAPYSWSFTAAGSLPSIAATVTGNGNINSSTGTPGIHASSPGSYSSPYQWNESVTLTATPSTGYIFIGWGGDGTCTGSATACTFIMNSSKTITATFLVQVQDNVRLDNGTTPYETVLDAYNAASLTGTVIKLRDKHFAETLNADNGTTVTLSGGYPAGFGTTHTGVTSITGLIISLGSLTIDNLTIK